MMDFDITFTDTVSGLGEEPGYVFVMFREHAANYWLAASRPDLDQHVANARKSLKRKKPVKVIVRGTEIISISAP